MEIHMFFFKISYTGELRPTDKEVKEAKWYTYDETLERLTNEEDKQFLQESLSKIAEFNRDIRDNQYY